MAYEDLDPDDAGPIRWSVSVRADGDREITLAEIVELADAVAEHGGIASGMGTTSYGAQVLVVADGPRRAAELASAVLTEAAARAGLPDWPVADVHVMSEEMDIAEDDEPVVF
ncbi:hypothetical protein [Nocardioides sp.]|uniref:hypothetical protein n=1 Tax=Nocardioides sp. TaxID=35761 RepID=UPI0039E728B0